MSAEILRAAADRLDELAGAATPGPWVRDSGWSITAPPPPNWSGPYVNVETKVRNDAYYIAAMHPEVGKALAEWLRVTATWQSACVPRCRKGDGCPDCDRFSGALAVANRILGGSDD